MITIKLSKPELELLANHWGKNVDYGWEGTFGGHDQSEKQAEKRFQFNIKKAKEIEKKLFNALYSK